MTAALSIDFGNSYTKVGIRRDQNEVSQTLRSEADLRYDEDNLCIPTVAARVVKNGKEQWLYWTQVKLGSKGSATEVFRNWKPRFFRGAETHLEAGKIRVNGKSDTDSAWNEFTDSQLEKLMTLVPEKANEVGTVLKMRRSAPKPEDQDFDFKEIGRGYFAWLRQFVEPFCKLNGIGATGELPVRITLPSFGANSAQARLTLEAILKETGWKPAVKRAALPEPVANMIGTFSSGRNFVWRDPKPGSPECYSLTVMIGESSLFKALCSYNAWHGNTRSPIYWIMIADLGGYTTDFAMVGFDLENAEIELNGCHDGKKLLADYSEPIGVHYLDKKVRDVLDAANRTAFDTLAADVDGLRIDRFHQEVYQRLRRYNTGQGSIGEGAEKSRIENVIRQFADGVADLAERFLLIEQYDHIDELILTGGGCNIPLVREAIRKKLERYDLRKSHIPLSDQIDLPERCQKLDRLLVRGATALGATSVYFDYD